MADGRSGKRKISRGLTRMQADAGGSETTIFVTDGGLTVDRSSTRSVGMILAVALKPRSLIRKEYSSRQRRVKSIVATRRPEQRILRVPGLEEAGLKSFVALRRMVRASRYGTARRSVSVSRRDRPPADD